MAKTINSFVIDFLPVGMIESSGILVWYRRVTGHRVCAACNFAGLHTIMLRSPNLEDDRMKLVFYSQKMIILHLAASLPVLQYHRRCTRSHRTRVPGQVVMFNNADNWNFLVTQGWYLCPEMLYNLPFNPS